MSPSAEPNAPAVVLPLAAEMLEKGEEVIFAIKPSGWFVLLVSLPAIIVAAAAACAAWFAADTFRLDLPHPAIQLVCLAAALARIVVACFQWMAHLYVLTNLRALHVRGIAQPELLSCRLGDVRETVLSTTPPERLLGLASLVFLAAGADKPSLLWAHLSRPGEIQQAVNDAIRRSR